MIEVAAILAQGDSGTDWQGITLCVAIVGLVASVLMNLANVKNHAQHRKEDVRERVRFRRLDRAERKRLIDYEMAAARRERLAAAYGEWRSALTATVAQQTRTFFCARELGDRKAHEERIKAGISAQQIAYPEGQSYLLAFGQESLSAADRLSEHAAQYATLTAELTTTASLIQIHESADVAAEVAAISSAVVSWTGDDIKEVNPWLTKAWTLIAKRITWLAVEADAARRGSK